MSSWIVPLIVVVVLIDAIVMWQVFTRRRLEALGGMTFIEFQRFAAKARNVVRDHMKVHYGGQPTELPTVLPDLLSKVDSQALASGIQLERAKLKMVTGRLISMQGLAPQDEVESALKQVA
jgi:hypothetical protein